jgi:hypothetical protein
VSFSGLRSVFLCSGLALALGGCASISPDVGDMTRAYAESVEKHERNQILKNLLRAGDGVPMSFTTVPTIVGTGQLEGSAGVSGKLFGELFSNATGNPSLRSSRGFNFTLASLDNERFTTAFLRDLSLDTVQVFATGDFHRQLLFTLVVDSVSFNLGRPNAQIIENGTSTQGRFDRFQETLAALVASGLTTERITRPDPIGIDLTREELLADRRFFGSDLVSDRSIRVVRIPTAQGDRYRVVRLSTGVRFCLSPQEFEKRSGLKLAASLACRLPIEAAVSTDAPSDLASADSLLIDIRSAREVYRFVGRLAMAQAHQAEWLPRIDLPQRQAGIVAGSHPLIVLRKGSPGPDEKVLAVAEHMGSSYYVPFENSGFSARVFEYLALLLSISMVKDAIPAQPAILVR